MPRVVLTLFTALMLALASRADENQDAEKAHRAVSEFERTLATSPRSQDYKTNKDRDAKIREFFNQLKDSTTKIEAIGMMDSRYVYYISKDLIAELLGKLIKDDDIKVRARAAHAIGYNGLGDRFADDIINLLKEKDPSVKRSVIYAMGRAQGDRFLPYLKELLADADRAIRFDAAFQLSWRPAEKVADDYRKLLVDRDDYVRATGLRYLARYAGEKPPLSIADLEKYLDDPSQDVRLAAIEALAHRGHDSTKRLSKLLDDPAPRIRTQTLQTLGALKAVDQIDAVVKALNDRDVVVRRYGVMAMEFVGAERPEALRAMLKDNDDQVREHAARILGVFRDAGAVEGLASLLSDKVDRVRREAVKALGQIAPRDYADAIAQRLADRDAQVRMFAARGLGKSGEMRFIKQLEEVAGTDANDVVRDSARAALLELKK
jgi:HEAT repeat protein